MSKPSDDLAVTLKRGLTYRKRRSPQPGLGRLQDLIGSMKNAYLNDRDPNRADKLIPMVDEAFEIAVRLNSRRTRR